MATVELSDEELIVHITGLDRVLAFKSSVTVPLEHIASVDQDAREASALFHGLKLPGTEVPTLVTAGTFLRHGEWTFWDVHDPARAVIIRLHDEHLARLVVGVDDPAETIAQIRAALVRKDAT